MPAYIEGSSGFMLWGRVTEGFPEMTVEVGRCGTVCRNNHTEGRKVLLLSSNMEVSSSSDQELDLAGM